MIIQSEPLTTSEESSSLDVATPINGCTEPSARKELVQASAVTPTGNLSPAHQPRCPSPSPSEHLITSPPPPVDLSQLTPVIVVRKGTEAVPIQKKLEVSSKSQPRTRKASKKRSTAYSTALQPTTAVDHPYARSCISNTNKPSPTKKQRSKLSAKQTTQLNPTDKVNNLQSDCFKRFYLQRQPDGKIVLVTQEEGTKPPKPLNSMLNADKLPHHLLLVNDSLVLDQVEEESKPSQMSTILQPTSQSHLSTNEPLVLSSSQQQTLAILSALKHDHPLLSMAASNYSQITSSTPTTSKKVDGLTPGSASHSNNTLEQNMLVASLPPVETIFGDRSLSLTHSSMQMLDQPDQTMANTSYNTIINDHHIDYYGQVDSTVDDEDEILSNSKYLPFGYFYDDEKELNQLISSSLPSSTTPSPLLDGVDLPHCTDRVGDIAGGNEEFAAFPNEVPFEFGNNNNNACETGYGASSESSVGHIMSNDTHQINSLIKQEKDDFPKMYLNRQFSHDQFNLDSSLADSSVFHDLYNTNETISAMGKSISPVIGKAQEPTLAQLNMPFHIEKEEDEDEIICWTNMEQDAFGNSFVPHSSNLLECGKVVDLNSQQQNLITSSTSPTSKHAPRSEVWLSSASTTQNAAPSKTVTISNSNVSSTMVEEFVVPDVVDDTSLEIEAIFRQSQQASTSCGSQKMFTSPPQISSSFGLKCQSIKMKPQLIAMSNGSEKQTLLSELLSNKNLSASNLIHSAKPNSRGFNQNLVSNPLPILAKNFNHHYVNVPKLENGNKSSLKCPTLAALISSPNVSINNNSMLNVTSGQPMSMNFSTGCGMTMITTHNSRIRNNSMSTDYSVSSHDEGFASQPDEEFEDSEPDDMMILQDNTDDLIDTDLFLIDGQNMLNLNCSVVDEPMYASANLATSTSLEATLPEVNSDLNLINCNSIKQEEDVQWSLATNADLSWIKQEKMSNKTLSAIDENEDESDEDDDDDESFYGDYDASDLIGATTSDDVNNKWSLNMGRSRKGNEKRYFWQYNVQAKGPKGPRIGSISASASFDEDSDPHVFNDISDPVFAPDCQVEGVKHSGKARRGDGNDLTPNPKKLLMIGLELKKLSKTINDLTPVTDLPFLCRNKSRKEKNKLASRACRLKKKAQHEANKIKLHGLHREHSKMMKIINEIRQVVMLGLKIKESNKPVFFVGEDYSVPINALSSIPTLVDRIKNANKPIRDIAGHTADFVNHVLDNVSAGITSGGLENV